MDTLKKLKFPRSNTTQVFRSPDDIYTTTKTMAAYATGIYKDT